MDITHSTYYYINYTILLFITAVPVVSGVRVYDLLPLSLLEFYKNNPSVGGQKLVSVIC